MKSLRGSSPWFLVAALWLAGTEAVADTYEAVPFDYRRALKGLEGGDTLILKPDDYKQGLLIEGLHGRPDAWIVIKGAEGGEQPRLLPKPGNNTVEIRGCSYVAIENLTIDGQDMAGIFAISASFSASHHIRIENCNIVGHGGSQQTVGISTKAPCWNWVIRRNRIEGAGTGMYLGDADGHVPFIAGLIEYNLLNDSRGYNIQLKHQDPRDPTLPGIPTTPQKTIIRHNVFVKGTLPSEDGYRPNLLVGALPQKGLGSEDFYEVYGNLFYHNDNESLIQAEGRISIHDNVFVDCTGDAIHFQNHAAKVRVAYAYNNTFYDVKNAIRFVHPATDDHRVVGNLMFSENGIVGPCENESGNIHVPKASAAEYVVNPTLLLGKMDFRPLPGKCKGDPLDLSPFAAETDSGRDFDGTTKDGTWRGAYSCEAATPGWQLDAAIKGELGPVANDKTPPTGSIRIAGGKGTTASLVVDLEIVGNDNVSGMGSGALMHFSNNGKDWSEPQPFAEYKSGWNLSTHGGTKDDGPKVVFARVSDAAGNWSQLLVAAIEYQTPGTGGQ